PTAGTSPTGPPTAGSSPSSAPPEAGREFPAGPAPDAWPADTGEVAGPPARVRRLAAAGRQPPGLRPAPQLLNGPLGPQRPLLYAQLQQVPVRLADHRARPHAEDLHDLVAVQIRADLLQLLPLRQERYALLQVVVGTGQPGSLLPVPGRAVGPGEGVQPGEQRPGVAH